MRSIISFLICVCIISFSYGQAPRPKLDENTVVKDSSGMVYAYPVWSLLLARGEYTVHLASKPGEDPVYFLDKLSEQQKDARMELIPKPKPSDFFRTGKDFVNFKATTLNNLKVNTKDERGKILVINFWFINCPPCRQEIPQLNELVAKYKGNDKVRFLAIALDARGDVKDFLATSPYNYEIVYNGSYVADQFGVKAYPTHVIVDQQGKIYFSATGLGMNTVYWIKKSIGELLVEDKITMK